VGLRASIYFNDIPDYEHLYNVDFTYSDYKRLSQTSFTTRIAIVLRVVYKFTNELKPYGIREKDLQRIEELKKQYDKIMALPRNLQCQKATTTHFIKKQLKELNKMQCHVIDNIAKSFFEPVFLKNEYRKARKIVQHKNPEGLFDDMLRRYRGVKKKKKVNRKLVLKNIWNKEHLEHQQGV